MSKKDFENLVEKLIKILRNIFTVWFVFLKVSGTVNWSWGAVISPLWIAIVVLLVWRKVDDDVYYRFFPS